MKVKTHPVILNKVSDAIGRGTVTKHEMTETNQIGQSGTHTFTDDIMNVIEEAQGARFSAEDAGLLYRALSGFLSSLHEFKREETLEFCATCLKVGDKCRCQ